MEEHTRQMRGSDRRHLADCGHTLGLRGVQRRQGSAATLQLIDRPGCRALRGGTRARPGIGTDIAIEYARR